MELRPGLTAVPIPSSVYCRENIPIPIQIACQQKEKLMRATWKTFAFAALCAASSHVSLDHVERTTLLKIDVENRVQYVSDISDVSKLASDPSLTTPVPARNFVPVLIMADIVAVNGQPAKGTSVFHLRQI